MWDERSIFYYMKNKYLTKYLCISLISTMILSSPLLSYAAGETESSSAAEEVLSDEEVYEFASEPIQEPTQEPMPEPTQEPVQEPEETPAPTLAPTETPEPTQTPTEIPSPTEAPSPTLAPTEAPEPTVAPTEVPEPTLAPSMEPTVSPEPTQEPEAPTPTPQVQIPEAVRLLIDRISALALNTITVDLKDEIYQLRADYNALSAEEQAMVTNYDVFVEIESRLQELLDVFDDTEDSDDDTEDDYTARRGNAVYVTNMVSNLHAGKDFYLNSLEDHYQLSFSEDFADVMKSIENEYKRKNKLMDFSDLQGSEVSSSSDSLLVRNWQDILAVYVYEKSKEGETSFTLNEDCKEELAEIFAQMNPVVRDKQNITKVTYGNRKINYYIKKNKISKSDRKILKKYTETDCKLLCAVVTAADGFVRESVGDDVSEERVNVITAAYSLIGKVGYFWGGKSTEIGEDKSWGTVEKVTASGSNSSGTMRAYGLDCSGFVTWAVINGYKDKEMQAEIGDGTSNQWLNANTVAEADAQPGDLVFQRGPEAGSDNHVGILCGKTDAGDWIAVHCSSSKNGVTVGEAYGASFRYIRQPDFYPDRQEQMQMQEGQPADTGAQTDAAVTSGNSLIEVFSAPQEMFSAGSDNGTADSFSSGSSSGAMVLPQSVSVEIVDVDIFE